MKKLVAKLEHEHTKKLFEFILEEVRSSSGDGDCFVRCKNYDAFNLADLFLEFTKNLSYPKLEVMRYPDSVVLVDNQEAWVFTNNLTKPCDHYQCVVTI